MNGNFQERVSSIAAESGVERIAVAFHDYETGLSGAVDAGHWFHAASTIKVPLLVAVFDAVSAGRFGLDAPLHVRNRFASVVGGHVYRISSERDANFELHQSIGKTRTVGELARHMIVTSSNLATNLLLDLIGIDAARASLAALKIVGIDLQRGVEDDRAFEAGINNRVTAAGLLRLFQLLYKGAAVNQASCEAMLDILAQQEFNGGIPAGLPAGLRLEARIAHKTGEISTIAHDAGLVYLPGRKPYAVAILTRWAPGFGHRQATIAKVSRILYELLEGSAQAPVLRQANGA